ncbi:hypothetical protein V8C37DRAFT_408226 [Trichoderma ceciliae]
MASDDMPLSSASPSPSDLVPTCTYDRPSRRQDFQIAIICALSLEYDAAILLVDEFWDQEGRQYGRTSGDTNMYRNGRIGMHNVVLTLLPNMGKAAVAGSAASLRTSYPNLKLVFLVGVCGGVPNLDSHEALLGDVVIGEAIVQYDFGRQYPGKFVPKDTAEGTLSAPNKDIRSLLAYFKSDAGKDDLRWNTGNHLKVLQGVAVMKQYQHSYRYPGFVEDKLFAATYRHKHREQASCGVCHGGNELFCDKAAQVSCADLGCDEDELVPRQRLKRKRDLGWEETQCPEIFIGRVASADTVMKSGDHRDQIAKQHSIVAFEMEGAGLWDEAPCIVVKGICDYADSHKNKIWQPFAAATAAAVTKAMLERYNLTDHPEPFTLSTESGRQDHISPTNLEMTPLNMKKSSSPSTFVQSNGSQTLWGAIFDFQSALTNDQRHELRTINAVPDADAVLVFTAELDSLNRNRKGRSIASRLYSVLQSVRDFSAFKRDTDDIKRCSIDIKDALSRAEAQADLQNKHLQSGERKDGSKGRKLKSFFSRRDNRPYGVETWQTQSNERRTKERRQQLLDSLSTYDYVTPLKQSRRKRYSGTSEWLFQTPEFDQWINSTDSPVLWCYGKIGSGKTILTAGVIDKLLTENHSPDVFIAFFFARFDNQQFLNAEAIIKSIIRQALNQSGLSDEIEGLLEHMQLRLSSGLKELLELIQKIATAFKALYLDRDDLLQVLSSLAIVGSNTKLFLASRDSMAREIQKRFPALSRLSMNCSSAESDISTYVEGIVHEKLQSEELVVGDLRLIEEIKLALTKGADGMFLWVAFQLDELGLQHCDDDIRKAIRNLPKDLEETFDRAVGRIVSRGEENIAKKVFRWVAAAKEPLSLAQLREAIFIEVGQQYSMPERRSNGIYNLSSWCENLVYIDEELETVQFAHETVRQFFLEKASKARHSQFYLELEDADHYIGEICVTYLNFNNFKTTLARRPQPLRPMPPGAIAITALKYQWKMAASIPILAKSSLNTQVGSTASSAVETMVSYQQNDTKGAKESLHAKHPFLRYASTHWIFHTTMFQKRRSKSWNIWQEMVLQGHDLAEKPWGVESFSASSSPILDWSRKVRHYALIQLISLSGMLSREDREQMMENAASEDDITLLNIVLEGPESGYQIHRAFLAGVECGHLDIVNRLLTAGAEVDAIALQKAAGGGHLDVVKRLLAAGAKANETALQEAAGGGHLDVVERLLAAGAETALQKAAGGGHLDVVERLLAAGAKADVYALQLAIRGGHLDVVSRLKQAGANKHNS